MSFYWLASFQTFHRRPVYAAVKVKFVQSRDINQLIVRPAFLSRARVRGFFYFDTNIRAGFSNHLSRLTRPYLYIFPIFYKELLIRIFF